MWCRNNRHLSVSCLLIAFLFLLQPITASRHESRGPDDLEIKTTHKVECDRKSQEGDTIHVHYTGTLKKNGKKFDSSYDRNEPIAFTLGSGQVIKGWDLGLKDMCIGEERKLIIPPNLAYGQNRVGKIPPGSTLAFETKLVAIDGVDPPPEDHHDAHDKEEGNSDSDYDDPTPTVPDVYHTTPGPDKAYETETASTMTPIKPLPDNPEEENECRLLGPFALFVQGGLGLLALLSLVWKRYRERPRRPLKIWFFDVSKQVIGSVLLHVLNLLMSILSSADFQLASKVKEIGTHTVAEDGRQINPCSFYLINIAIDTTIGIPILVVLLRILHFAFRMTPLARPVESIKSGHYGQPPRVTWWLKQGFIYFIGLVLMKLCVFFIVEVLPWIAWVGDWALRWTEGNEALQIAFVMFVFPLIMNALQYYIIDSFIKEPGVSDYSQPNPSDDQAHGPSYHTVAGYDSDRDSLDGEDARKPIYTTSSQMPAKEQQGDQQTASESTGTSRTASGRANDGNAGPL